MSDEDRPTIMLALSDAQLSMAVGMKLEEAGWQVAAVQNGREAIEYHQDHKPVAVLAPMLLADMTGPKLLREIRFRDDAAVLVLLTQTSGSASQLQIDAQCNAVVDPRNGVDGILRALDRFSKITGVAPASREGKRQVRLGRAAPLPGETALRAGSLSRTDPARLVGGVLRLTLTGVLSFTHEEKALTRKITVDKGVPVFAASSHEHERFGEYLVRNGHITRAQLTRALGAGHTGRKLGTVLVSLGSAGEEEIERWVQAHVRERLTECFGMREGTYAFTPQDVDPPTRPDELPEPLELLRMGVHSHYQHEEVASLLPGAAVLKPALPVPGIARLARLNTPGQLLIAKLDGRTPLGQLIIQFGKPLAAHQLFYALYAGGVLSEVR